MEIIYVTMFEVDVINQFFHL